MKKLINSADQVVRESLAGVVALGAGVAALAGENTLLRADLAQVHARGEVALISGGGAGHEPAHAGFVGPGLLTAAVSGQVSATPRVAAVLSALRAACGPAGALLIVKNYTGDRLNFGLAAEIARAEGLDVRMVVVADDAALGDATATGRRGLAGTLFVHKVAGAAAALGLTLAEVAAAAQHASDSVRTMGVGLTACTLPGAARPGFELGSREIELGLGIHGEPGVRRAELSSADQLVAQLLDRVVTDLALARGSRVALLVNGLGATPQLELGVVARAALAWLDEHGILVERALCGSYLTALDMAGCSLSLMKVDEDLLHWLDAPAQSLAWPSLLLRPTSAPPVIPALRQPPPQATAPRSAKAASPRLRIGIEAVVQSLLQAESQLTELDRAVGDGDLGTSLAQGAAAIRRDLGSYPSHPPAATFRAMAATVRHAVGGTSGPLYALGLLRAAQALESMDARYPLAWAQALEAAAEAIAKTGGASLGDRTMLDAMFPAARAMRETLQRGSDALVALKAAAAAAEHAAAQTADLVPRRGRASYLGERALGHPDPGAHAVAVWLRALATALAAEPVAPRAGPGAPSMKGASCHPRTP